jgi:RNA polymerase sigma factor (sigma-70 family)
MDDFEPPDAVLISRSLADPDEFRLVFRRHYPSVARFLERRVGASRGEELAAETFARAFARRGRYVPATPTARPWLFGIASNLASSARRAEERQLRAYARLPFVRGDDETTSADARIDARTETAELVDALLALSQKDREALLLYAWADLSYAEIAAALGIPIGTVRSRISRARLQTRGTRGTDPVPPLTEGACS